MKITRRWGIPFLGYGFAALTGKIIYHLNELFFPEFATRGHLAAWVLIMGTLFTLMMDWNHYLEGKMK